MNKLTLQSGEVFQGKGLEINTNISGEIVFSTAMAGYENLVSEPKLEGKILCLTYPLVGNYGINKEDFEKKPSIKALIIKELCDAPSNFRADYTLQEYSQKHNLPIFYDIDTRKLTKIIRENGSVSGEISAE